MASTPIVDLRPRSVGELLDLTFLLYRRNFLRLIGITLVVLGPVLALNLLSSTGSLLQYMTTLSNIAAGSRGGTGAGMTALLSTAIAGCAGGLTLLIGIFMPWMEGALTYNIIEHVLGRKPDWRESYRAARPRWGSLWVANAIRSIALWAALIPFVLGLYGVLIGAVVAFGAAGAFGGGLFSTNSNDGNLLFIGLIGICLPVALLGGGVAIFIEASWSMVIPVVVGEGVDGAGSLGRSNALVKGHRMRMIGRLLLFEAMRFFVLTLPVLAIEAFFIGGSIAATTTGAQSPLSVIAIIAASLLSAVENVLVVPFYVAYITVNYLDLRVRKENLALQIQAANIAPLDSAGLVDSGAPIVTATSIAPPPEMQTVVSSPILDMPSLAVINQLPAPQEIAPAQPTAPSEGEMTIPAQTFSATLTPAQRISALFKRLRAEGENAEILNQLGLAYQEVGDLFGAQDSFTRARALAPDNPQYAHNMALLQKDRRDLPAARQAMSDYLRLETNSAERQKVIENPALKELLP